MVSLLVGFLKRIFGRKTETPVEDAKPTGFNIEHEWPFPSPKPLNTDFLINQLINGVRVEGDHVFYFWKDQKRRHIRTVKGTETILARNIVWWMEGRKHPKGFNGLTTTCGEVKCIKLSHLILRGPQTVYGPKKAPAVSEPNHVVRKKKPAQAPPAKFEKGDRSKCITAKVFFETEKDARKKQTVLNSKEVRGRGRRVYPYKCDRCIGYHLTKIKPGNYKKPTIKNSSW